MPEGERAMAAEASSFDPALPAAAAAKLGDNYRIAVLGTYAIHAALELGLTDELSSDLLTPDQIAGRIGAHPESLARLMRALASLDVLAERDGRFGLGPLAPFAGGGSVGTPEPDDVVTISWLRLADCVRAGRPSFELAYGMPLFEYLSRDPKAAGRFHTRMEDRGAERDAAVAEACDFEPFETIVDVGGGTGGLLGRILDRHRTGRGVLFELPEVLDAARSQLEPSVSDRITFVPGDFFETVPGGGDAYLLSSIIHDWDDEPARRILRNVRTAMASEAQLFLVEGVRPIGERSLFVWLLDVEMMLLTGGRERDADEYERLLSATGFALEECIPTQSNFSVLRARAV